MMIKKNMQINEIALQELLKKQGGSQAQPQPEHSSFALAEP